MYEPYMHNPSEHSFHKGHSLETTNQSSNLLSHKRNHRMQRPSFKDYSIDDSDFDVFQLRKLSNNQELLTVAFKAFLNNSLFDEFSIQYRPFVDYWRYIQGNYINTNPYHNKTHAADVMWFVYDWLKRTKWDHNNGDPFFSKFDILCLLFSAGIHDFKHPGYTNNFLVNSDDSLAYVYNDYSVLEMYHVSEALKTLKNFNFLKELSKQQAVEFREVCIKLVLGTDMSNHFSDLKDLKNLLDLNTTAAEGDSATNVDFEEVLQPANKILVMRTLLHLCDISSPLKEPRMSYIWGQRCVIEFFFQGDKEKKMGLPLASELFDRDLLNYNKSQVGFYEFIALPLYRILSIIISDPYKENVEQNLKRNKESIEIVENIPMRERVPNYVMPDIFEEYRAKQDQKEEDEERICQYYRTMQDPEHRQSESAKSMASSMGIRSEPIKDDLVEFNDYTEVYDVYQPDKNDSDSFDSSEGSNKEDKLIFNLNNPSIKKL